MVFALFATHSMQAQTVSYKNYLDAFNPGFETSTATDPAPYWFTQIDSSGSNKAKGAITFTTVNPHSGLRALRVETTAIDSGMQWHVQATGTEFTPFPVLKPGTKDTQSYTIRFWAKADVNGRIFNTVAQQGSPGYETPFEQPVTLTTSWKQYSFDFKLKQDYLLRQVFHFGLGKGVYYIDDVELGTTAELNAPPAVNPNLILGNNPSFETAGTAQDPAPQWFLQVDSSSPNKARGSLSVVKTSPQDGAQCLQAIITGVDTAAANNAPYHIQAVNNPFVSLKQYKADGKTLQSYTLRYWAKADANGKKIVTYVQNASYGTSAVPGNLTLPLTSNWAAYDYVFTLSKDDALHPVVHFGLQTGIFFVDNFILAKTEDLPALPVSSTNLMDGNNPGFETAGTTTDPAPKWFLQVDSTKPNLASGSITVSKTNPQEGLQALNVVVTGVDTAAANNAPYHIQAVSNPYINLAQFKADGKTAQSYTLRFWAKADAAGKQIITFIQNSSYASPTTPGNSYFGLTTAWKAYDFVFTMTKDDAVHANVHFGLQKGTYNVDNFILSKTEDLPALPSVSTNLILANNPGFEVVGTAADPAPNWFLQVDSAKPNLAKGSLSVVKTNPQEGLQCLQAIVTGVDTAAANNAPYHIQAVSNPFTNLTKLKADGKTAQSYTLRFWAKADAAGKQIRAFVQNSSYGTSAVPENKTLALTAAWAQYDYTFTLSKDDALHPVVHFGLQTGTFFVDNFQLSKSEDLGVFGVDVQNLPELSNVVVFPNPTTGLLQIRNAETLQSVDVFNMSGSLMLHKTFANGETSFDVSDLNKGIYLLSIQSKEGVAVAKFVKL